MQVVLYVYLLDCVYTCIRSPRARSDAAVAAHPHLSVVFGQIVVFLIVSVNTNHIRAAGIIFGVARCRNVDEKRSSSRVLFHQLVVLFML